MRVGPPCAVSVNGHSMSSGVRVTPMTIAPAARSRRTSSQSSGSSPAWACEPRTRGVPATAMSSLTAIGTPSSGRSIPARDAAGRLVGLEQRALVEHDAKRVDLAIQAPDALERVLDEVARRDVAGADELGLARDAGEGEVAARRSSQWTAHPRD